MRGQFGDRAGSDSAHKDFGEVIGKHRSLHRQWQRPRRTARGGQFSARACPATTTVAGATRYKTAGGRAVSVRIDFTPPATRSH